MSSVPVKLFLSAREGEENSILTFVQARRAHVFEGRNIVAVELSEVRGSNSDTATILTESVTIWTDPRNLDCPLSGSGPVWVDNFNEPT